MPELDTAQNSGTAAATDANATSVNSNQQNQNSSQPANGGQADASSAEGNNRNSGRSDGGDGGDGDDGGSGRPSRAQRTINDLTAKYREAQKQLSDRDEYIQQIVNGVDPSKVNLPAYSPGEEISPERIKKDVVSAASQIAAMTMAPALKDMASKIIQRDGAGRAVREFREAIAKYPKLNEADKDTYDEGLASRIEKSYERFFAMDPDYSFTEHLELFGPELDSKASTQSSQDERSTTRGGNRGTSINRGSGGGTRRSAVDPEKMNLDDLETYIHTMNG